MVADRLPKCIMQQLRYQTPGIKRAKWQCQCTQHTDGVSGCATCWTTTFGWDLLGDWTVAGEGAVVGLVTAGCWTGVGGGCTARYIFVGPNTPCLPVAAWAMQQINFTMFYIKLNVSRILPADKSYICKTYKCWPHVAKHKCDQLQLQY